MSRSEIEQKVLEHIKALPYRDVRLEPLYRDWYNGSGLAPEDPIPLCTLAHWAKTIELKSRLRAVNSKDDICPHCGKKLNK